MSEHELKVLGLDLSLRGTGLCMLYGSRHGEPSMHTERFDQPKVSGVEASIKRLIAIAEQIVGLAKCEKPDHAIIEAPAKNQQWQAAAIGEVHGVIKVQLFLATGIVPLVKEATQMRRHVVGKLERVTETVVNKKGKEVKRASYGKVIGASGKPRRATVKDVIEIRLRDRGLQFPSQDEMDAYVAARFCWDTVIGLPGCGSDDAKKKAKRA